MHREFAKCPIGLACCGRWITDDALPLSLSLGSWALVLVWSLPSSSGTCKIWVALQRCMVWRRSSTISPKSAPTSTASTLSRDSVTRRFFVLVCSSMRHGSFTLPGLITHGGCCLSSWSKVSNFSVKIILILRLLMFSGMTHAAVWAAACSYIMASTEPELRSSAQGVMQGIYQGLGRGCGSILGGVVIHRFGNETP